MSTPKQDGVVGIARASSATEQPAAPVMYPICEDANIEGEPFIYEQINSVTPDPIGAQGAGHDLTWAINGIEPNAHMLGYIAWLALGGQSTVTSLHTIIPADQSQYLVPFIDSVLDLGTAEPTETGLGAKIGSWSFEVNSRSYVKMSVSGMLCALGALDSALSASIESGANNAPLSWHGLRTGGFKIGYSGATRNADTALTSVKFDYSREQKGNTIELGADQPSGIIEGMRGLDFEVTRDFAGSAGLLEYNAWKLQAAIGIEMNFTIGSSTVQIVIPNSEITGSYRSDIGVGVDAISGTLKCKAFQVDSDELITVVVEDGNSGDYT